MSLNASPAIPGTLEVAAAPSALLNIGIAVLGVALIIGAGRFALRKLGVID